MTKIKILFAVMIALACSSCTQEDDACLKEYVECNFQASWFTTEIDDAEMSKANGSTREIKYVFTYANGSAITPSTQGLPPTGTINEDTYFQVYLPKNENYKVYFVYDNLYETGNQIHVNSSNTYYTTDEFSIADVPVHKEFTLERVSAEFIATVGTIPAGDSLKILISTIDSFDWLTGSTSVLGDPQGGTFITGESTHNYAYGGVSNNVSVAVSLINSAGVVRMTNTYTYSVEENHVKTVTYNVGGDSFYVSISDAETIEDPAEDQEVTPPTTNN